MNTTLDQATDQATRLYDRAAQSARDTAMQVRDQALRAQDRTVGYIRDEPVKAVLISLAVGAGIMALARYAVRGRL